MRKPFGDKIRNIAILIIIVAMVEVNSGCAHLKNGFATLFAPSEEVLEITLETPEALPRDDAILYLIKHLNATQYGIVLQDVFSRAAKPFDFDDMYLRLQHRRVRGLFKTVDTYQVLLVNTCKLQDGSGIQDFFEKSYSFSSLEEATRICTALVAAGVRLCCDEGCDDQ